MVKRKEIILTEQQFRHLLSEMTNQEIDDRCNDINENPTEGQKKAGNYAMAHITFSGFKITLENAKGSKRYWKDDKGNTGFNVMKNHYGYFSNSLGHDGDHVDVFLGDNQDSDKVYIVDQNKKDGTFDESKVMLGFDSKKEAKEAYLSNFTPDWKGFRSITGVTKKFFKKWLYNGRKQQKPFADYVEVIKKKLNESKNDDSLILNGDYTDKERDVQLKKEKKAVSARKAAENKKKKEEKKKAEDAAFWKQQDELGYKNLFGESLVVEDNHTLLDVCESYTLYDLLQEFIEDKEKGVGEKHWNVIPKEPYWNALRNYMQYGEAFRTPDYLIEDWLQIIYHNILSLEYMTILAGHTAGFADADDLESAFFPEDYEGDIPSGYDGWSGYLEEIGFYDWCKLPDGSDAWSDYGLKPLWRIITKIDDDASKGEKLIAINRCLDVAHQRGDLASMFIEGGKQSCYEISHS